MKNKISTEQVTGYLYHLGQAVGEVVKYEEEIESVYFHDVISCGKPLQVKETFTRGHSYKENYVRRIGFCPTHKIRVCFCGWEKGHHFDYTITKTGRTENKKDYYGPRRKSTKRNSPRRRLAVYG